jgi:NADH-quinone oxidoreductase subunit D
MYESLSIIEQCLERVISYNLNLKYKHLIKPLNNFFKLNVPLYKYKQTHSSMEELIHQFKLHSQGYSLLPNKSYQAIESPKGEFGITLVSRYFEKSRPTRLKIKAPGFNNLQSYNIVTAGCLLTDALTILGSFDIVLGEIDR